MIRKYKISFFLFVLFIRLFTSFAQNPNVIVKCSETTTDYVSNSKNKIKSVSTVEVSKKDKKKKVFKSKVWYAPSGCAIKSIYSSPNNSVGGNYTTLISEYNTIGYRTKFEQFQYDKDSIPVLVFSEFVEFDSSNRLKQKQTEHHLSKINVNYFTESYNYNDSTYAVSATQNERLNAQFPYTTNIYKYKNIQATGVPDYSERVYYTNSNSYTKRISEQSVFDYYITVVDGKITQEQKIDYEKNAAGALIKETTTDLIINKKTKEIIHHTSHEYEVINYDKEGNKTNSYTERLPYSDPVPDIVQIEGYSYDMNVKKDTVIFKNGGFKVQIFEKQYVDGKTQDKLSQTLEYNKNKLLVKQDVLFLEAVTEYEYEYY